MAYTMATQRILYCEETLLTAHKLRKAAARSIGLRNSHDDENAHGNKDPTYVIKREQAH